MELHTAVVARDRRISKQATCASRYSRSRFERLFTLSVGIQKPKIIKSCCRLYSESHATTTWSIVAWCYFHLSRHNNARSQEHVSPHVALCFSLAIPPSLGSPPRPASISVSLFNLYQYFFLSHTRPLPEPRHTFDAIAWLGEEK